MVLTFQTPLKHSTLSCVQPRGLGRLYVIVYPKYFKVGRSQNIRYRIREQIRGANTVHVGPVSEDYKAHERWYHENCAAKKHIMNGWNNMYLVETYQRDAGIEAATLAWFAADYSEALRPTISLIAP